MSEYIGARALRKHGVRIEGSMDSFPVIPEGKRIVGIFQYRLNGKGADWEIAADLTEERVREEWVDSLGFYSRYELYELDEALLSQCPDEGRVLIED